MELSDFLTEEGKEVNWKAVKEVNPRIRGDVFDILKEAGFLTYRAKGNYSIIQQGIQCGPSEHMGVYYFLNEKAARDYKAVFHEKTMDTFVVKFL